VKVHHPAIDNQMTLAARRMARIATALTAVAAASGMQDDAGATKAAFGIEFETNALHAALQPVARP
jgi:hypothetical protein